ncbi:hypothetical protein [Nonomuraea wenchangensis]|uniref:hypothetical protein n=1 Tax=Nonomuraea wenchangensis TaxID=568860 RepID=UPI003328EF9D
MTTARVVFATWSRPVSNTDTLQMYWLCECGADGIGPAQHATRCAGCHQTIVIPAQPMPADAEEAAHAVREHLPAKSPQHVPGISAMLTTAEALATYRDELRAYGFTTAEVQALVIEAARTCRAPWAFIERRS